MHTAQGNSGERRGRRHGPHLRSLFSRALQLAALWVVILVVFLAGAAVGGSADPAGPKHQSLLSATATAAQTPTPTPTRTPDDGGKCGQGYRKEGETPQGYPLCTHGPDELPLPWGDSYEGQFANDDPNVQPIINHCAGDGSSGERIHWFYIYAAGTPNNLANGTYNRSQFREKIGIAESYLSESDANYSQKFRNLCKDDTYVVLTGKQCPDQNNPDLVLDTVRQCLEGAGHSSTLRIYAAFIDGYEEWDQQGLAGAAYRGGGADDSPTPDGRAPSYAVINTWTGYMILHEVGHMLGSVFDSAPHSTAPYGGGGHCWDEFDAMCYDDNKEDQYDPIVYECSDNTKWWRFDCGHNKDNHDHADTAGIDGGEDYWDPNGGSRYLATHWNTAASYFLTYVGL